MQIQGAVSLATMQKDGDSGNGDVGGYQSKNGNLPPWPIQISISKPLKKQIKTWNCIQKEIPKES